MPRPAASTASTTPDPLQPYRAKRDFAATPEPAGERAAPGEALGFVVQKHAARRLHYDFRLELDGTLKSWAVPKGPSLDPGEKRMAVQVEDHPVDYAGFEGTIPAGHYGAGEVIVWDRGRWQPVGDARAGLREGKLKFVLHGHKLQGAWTLVRIKSREGERQPAWLLIKERDDFARGEADYSVVEAEPDSVLDRTPARRRGAAKPAARSAPATAKPATAAKPSKPALAAAPAAPKAELPDRLAPALATLVDAPPTDDGWLWEVKFDGYRLLARVERGRVQLFTRNGLDWSDRLPGLVRALAALKLGSAWIDGEIVVLNERGTPDFQALQNAFDGRHTERVHYYVFDLPFHGGRDLRALPLVERRERLRALVAGADEPLRFSEAFEAAAGGLLESACAMRLEGLIGKRADSRYPVGRSKAWIKLKCQQRQEFVIGGYTDPQGSRSGLGSLLLGVFDAEGVLRYAGNVGTGFDAALLQRLERELSALQQPHSPFTPKPAGKGIHWLRPERVAEVAFAEWTAEGRVRHAVFKGLRADKAAPDVGRERAKHAPRGTPAADRPAAPAATAARAAAPSAPSDRAATSLAKSPARAAAKAAAKASSKAATKASAKASSKASSNAPSNTPAKNAKPTAAEPSRPGPGIRVTNADRVVDASTGITKGEVVAYFERAAEFMLPLLAERPVALLRAPAGIEGELFFQKHVEGARQGGLATLDPALDAEHAPMLHLPDRATLLAAAQLNAVEVHVWNARARAIEQPDRVVFDLDPGEGVRWAEIVEGAALVRALLDELGLKSFLKTSGGKGLHVMVPITPQHDWDTVKGFSRAVVQHLAAHAGQRFVAKSGPKNRVGRIFVDYLRNGRGATTAAAFSPRARPGLPISLPLSWDELPGLAGNHVASVRASVEQLAAGAQAWAPLARSRQRLDAAMARIAAAAAP